MVWTSRCAVAARSYGAARQGVKDPGCAVPQAAVEDQRLGFVRGRLDSLCCLIAKTATELSEHVDTGKRRVVIVGGGVAGLESLLALLDLARERVALTSLPRNPISSTPLLVEEPFDLGPAERHELEPLTAEKGAKFVLSAVSAVRPEDHVVELDDGSTLRLRLPGGLRGGRFKPAIDGATTFPDGEAFSADRLLERAEARGHRVAFIVPAGVTWSLPLYELADDPAPGHGEGVDAKIAVITPESAPLAIFGPAASAAVGELLAARGIQLFTNSTVRDLGGAGITLNPGDRRIGPSESIALPRMEGPRIDGLPADEDGFIPVDGHGRVKGVEDVYAAGDGTNFPIKQGGLGLSRPTPLRRT